MTIEDKEINFTYPGDVTEVDNNEFALEIKDKVYLFNHSQLKGLETNSN